MQDLTIHTRPALDVPLALIALGLAVLLAMTTRGALAPHASVATPSPIVSPVPTVTAAPVIAPPAPKKGDKGRG